MEIDINEELTLDTTSIDRKFLCEWRGQMKKGMMQSVRDVESEEG